MLLKLLLSLSLSLIIETEHHTAAADRVQFEPLPEHAANQSMEQSDERRTFEHTERQKWVSLASDIHH